MKSKFVFMALAVIALALVLPYSGHTQLLKRIKNTVKNTAENRADEGAADATNKAIDAGADAVKNKKGQKQGNTANDDNTNSTNENNGAAPRQDTPSIKSYANYDFVPGDKILFEDNFSGEQDGEFPSHWELDKGQAVLNKITGKEALAMTDGNYAYVTPQMKTADYLTDPFTIEYDDYLPCGDDGCASGLLVFFKTPGSSDDYNAYVSINENEAGYYTDENGANLSMNSNLPSAIRDDNFKNQWHHIAIACKNKQLKVYIDQYRVLVVPDMKMTPASIRFGGIGQQDAPLLLTNVRVASGGSMNMIGKKFTESKIVTHGINFDIDKAVIRPESMGTLNMIVKVLKDNPGIKFEIDGHTDNTGNAAHNLTLSQQRADAVKDQLVSLGIDASRLTVKGFGDTKPIDDNSTPEGKSNNRRVEFVKM